MTPQSVGAEREEGAAEAADLMSFVKPLHMREEVNAAGQVLLDAYGPEEKWQKWTQDHWEKYYRSLDIINNWRAAHALPLNTFQTTLRINARRFDEHALIAQRMKRLVSIAAKLHREPKMKLSQMQDIGGCRAIVRSVSEVQQLVNYYRKESRISHEWAKTNDYIAQPKDSGYRGVHLIYRYHSDRRMFAAFNGLKIEMQIRSRYQHAWATAVETVGTFVQQALKSSQGPDEWLRFFAVMGSVIALRERKPLVPDTPSRRAELLAELAHYATKLDVDKKLRSYGVAVRNLRQRTNDQARYYLLQLDPSTEQLSVSSYAANELPKAQTEYADAERVVRQRPGNDAVLVSVDSLALLERAYPNYFADTRMFVQLMNQALTGQKRGISVPPLKIPTESTKAVASAKG